MPDNFIATYRGIKILTKPDRELTEIILPESMISYLEDLEKLKKEYMKMKVEDIFK